jgi:hypothetical protein
MVGRIPGQGGHILVWTTGGLAIDTSSFLVGKEFEGMLLRTKCCLAGMNRFAVYDCNEDKKISFIYLPSRHTFY